MPGNFMSATPNLSKIPASVGFSNPSVTILSLSLIRAGPVAVNLSRKASMIYVEALNAFKKMAYAAEIATIVRYGTLSVVRSLPFTLNSLQIVGISLRNFSVI